MNHEKYIIYLSHKAWHIQLIEYTFDEYVNNPHTN